VGSTIVYAHMQAVGMVNDHIVDCFRHAQIVRGGRPKKNRLKDRVASRSTERG
jgi:DNA-3-methyladenine glycosylase I